MKDALEYCSANFGPALGQCCGGAVVLWTEVVEALPEVVAGVVARGPGEMPLAGKRVLDFGDLGVYRLLFLLRESPDLWDFYRANLAGLTNPCTTFGAGQPCTSAASV